MVFRGNVVNNGDTLKAPFPQPLEQAAQKYSVRLVNFAFSREIAGKHVVVTSNLTFQGLHGAYGSNFLSILETSYRSLVWQPPPARLCLAPGPAEVALTFTGFDGSAKNLGNVYVELLFEPVA